jgi:acyl-CoA dehydrogenase
MEVLAEFGTEEQRRQWLQPLLDGRIRSAFAMTEPEGGLLDATNIGTRITLDGDDYVINGHKFYISAR